VAGSDGLLDATGALDLLDWRRRVSELYAQVRAAPAPDTAWARWRAARDELFATHPSSPIPPPDRAAFRGLGYFPYDPTLRVVGSVTTADPEHLEIGASDGGSFGFTRVGRVAFSLDGGYRTLDVFWLDGYAGGVFVPFRDETSGAQTYGGGRYLLDTAKGADLGAVEGGLVLDFNFAYAPSCAHDPRWACPLAPSGNVLPIPVRAGELSRPRG
jgi:uncharacterized protein (DUF1684 family)